MQMKGMKGKGYYSGFWITFGPDNLNLEMAGLGQARPFFLIRYRIG